MRGIANARFNMIATVLRGGAVDSGTEPTGYWDERQNPDTGAVERVWVEQDAPEAQPFEQFNLPCQVRAFLDTGYRSPSNLETYEKGEFEIGEFIKMFSPASYPLQREDRVTNIRTREGILVWQEEATGKPTKFDIRGVNPILDPFNRHIENMSVLRRVDVQG